ncbi:MAG: M20 family metallopeptidase [Planctomycetaceae bacterium]
MPSPEVETTILRPAALLPHPELAARIRPHVNRERLLRTSIELIAIPSPTGDARAALDALADILAEDGFAVERPAASHPSAPAVVVRHSSGRIGPTLQFDGHLDVVHLPYVPPAIEGDRLSGSGSCDMKAGLAAAVEALRALRDSGTLKSGSVLLTAHDLHEAPWAYGEQLEALIRAGIAGDAVLVPESVSHCLPVVGRGMATWKVTIRRAGPPVHEVLRPLDEPSVIDAGAELIARLRQYAAHLADRSDAQAGCESVFIGQVHSGEIFNQCPHVCWLEGTRRWLPGADREAVEVEFRAIARRVAERTGTAIDVEFHCVRDAFRLDPEQRVVQAFFESHATVSRNRPLPCGAKPFCDDGNTFWSMAGIPAVTHGPLAGGAHTVHEWVSIDDLERVALVYALTAAVFCSPS